MEGTLSNTMREWMDAQLAAGLPALAGSSVSGTLALRPELLNELLGRWLTEAPTTGAPLEIDRVKPLIKRAHVRIEGAAVLVDFTLAV